MLAPYGAVLFGGRRPPLAEEGPEGIVKRRARRKGRRLDGFRLSGGAYQPIVPDARGWLWSEQLGLFVGLWQGWAGDQEAGWVWLYRPDGTLVPTPQEQAEAAEQRAEEERQRAEIAEQRVDAAERRAQVAEQRAKAAETELARLRALIQEQGRG